MVDATGLLNHLFVLEEHRKKGLGNIIELDLARKLIDCGNKVYKCVEFYNTPVIAGTQRSPLWSTAKNAEGTDLTYVFLVAARESAKD
ncbi:hypothetical protein OESDEN_22169 [Oesophagostomum dentatum]|uniref:Glycine N-acyltransferase-like protein n=1 Tax=Oesophagostomum dentatum TaxID=61180 RepID=A0A0B1S2V4_OESDE|nr:hypothetical protein OESDEN_22169 [Oesophagostomum dentatum]